MKSKELVLADIKKAIQNSKHAVIASHKNPEIDCIASAVVVSLIFDSLKKNYTLYNPDVLPYNCGYLKNSEKFKRTLPKEYDLVIVVDCGEIERIGEAHKVIQASSATVINIDHHLTNTNFGHVNYVEPQAAATSEVLYDVMKLFPESLTRDMAIAIYSSLMADTGSFRYSSTSERTFVLAAEMLKVGINSWDVSEKIYENQPLSRIKLIQLALGTLAIDKSKKIGSILVSRAMMKKTKVTSAECDGLINYPRSIQGVEVALQYRELEKDLYKVSFRSKGKVNVAEIAQSFGGGGHRNASGCELKGSLDSIKKKLLKAIKEKL